MRQLLRDPTGVVPLRQFNRMPKGLKWRAARTLIPPGILVSYNISPITGERRDGAQHLRIASEPETDLLRIDVSFDAAQWDPFFSIELQDTIAHGLQLNWLALNDPHSPRYEIDVGENGQDLFFGMVGRNLVAEQRAMRAGLAPAQIRGNLGASRAVIQTIETFVLSLSYTAFLLEPLTYVSAWVFERRGCSYVRGHHLMDSIHREFQPGGVLYRALDGSTPFRQPDQWQTVRGRAWAIHDGILAAMDRSWDDIRMIKRVGRDAGVNTMPGVTY
jgi:hypothetical protein